MISIIIINHHNHHHYHHPREQQHSHDHHDQVGGFGDYWGATLGNNDLIDIFLKIIINKYILTQNTYKKYLDLIYI
jgi:hypothetical protein